MLKHLSTKLSDYKRTLFTEMQEKHERVHMVI